jgi:nucleoside-diphosphate-sugar epimerase
MTGRALRSIVVTGGSGKAGRPVVRRLVEAGYGVINVDLAPSRDNIARFLRADLTEYGQALDALKGSDAVVHLAAIPAPKMRTDEVTFRTNVTSTYNVFAAATTLGLKRVVWASSETVLGLPFEKVHPDYAPIDEQNPLYPESMYALSKVVGEELARQFNRWSGLPFVGLRFSNVIEPEDYDRFTGFWGDVQLRKWNLWGYVDARDVAQSCQRALEAKVTGAQAFIIAAADTVMNRPSRDLMREVFPKVPVRDVTEYGTLLSIDKARRALGYSPEHSWRKYVS